MENRKPIGKSYDLVIVGGGITGAGVFHEAVKRGFYPLLVEANDFAWGTSSRSSKMVHGGLRYLKEGKLLLTRASVKERQRLLGEYPGLVNPLNFIMPLYADQGPSMGAMKFGLSLYSLMAGERQHKIFSKAQTLETIPEVRQNKLLSSVGFKDAQVDDARLVLRLIFDGSDMGGHALNYTRATSIERNSKGEVTGVLLKDTETGLRLKIKTRVVVNATGVMAEALHPSPGKKFHIRPLRGSHLIFPKKLFPIDRVLSFVHPADKRPIFLFPWEDCLFLGTTDVDHGDDVNMEPGITSEEADYLMTGLASILPDLKVTHKDCIASMAGVRPVLSKKKIAASKESREHVVWTEKGLVTITGGKLTTFRLLAEDALKAARKYLPDSSKKSYSKKTEPIAANKNNMKNPYPNKLSIRANERLWGRYGARTKAIAAMFHRDDFSRIADTTTLWAELCHGAQNEQIRHLSDLLLRRVRIGLFLPDGGVELMDEIQSRISPLLDWDEARWEREKKSYRLVWLQSYAPPGVKDEVATLSP